MRAILGSGVGFINLTVHNYNLKRGHALELGHRFLVSRFVLLAARKGTAGDCGARHKYTNNLV